MSRPHSQDFRVVEDAEPSKMRDFGD